MALAFVAMLLAGCADETEPLNNGAEDATRLPISLSVSEADSLFTRAAGTQNDKFIAGEPLKVSVVKAGATSTVYYSDLDYTVDGSGNLTGNIVARYPSGGSGITVIGTYPNTVSSAKSSTFTVQPDQSTEAAYRKSDLIWGTVTQGSPTPNAITIPMSHMTAKLTFNVTVKDGLTLNNVMVNMQRSFTFDPLTGAITSLGSKGDVLAYNSGESGHSCLVPPVSGQNVTFKVNTSESSAELSQRLSFESGFHYQVNLTVSRQGLTIEKMTLAAWNQESNTTTAPAPKESELVTGGLSASVKSTVSKTYNGNPQTLTTSDLQVYFDGNLTNDYTIVRYFGNTNAGTAIALIQGTGNKSKYNAAALFVIKPKDISRSATFTLPSNVTFDGKEHNYMPTNVKDGSTALILNKDYVVDVTSSWDIDNEYNSRVKPTLNDGYLIFPAEYKVTVRGTGNYTGTTTEKTFKIAKKPLQLSDIKFCTIRLNFIGNETDFRLTRGILEEGYDSSTPHWTGTISLPNDGGEITDLSNSDTYKITSRVTGSTDFTFSAKRPAINEVISDVYDCIKIYYSWSGDSWFWYFDPWPQGDENYGKIESDDGSTAKVSFTLPIRGHIEKFFEKCQNCPNDQNGLYYWWYQKYDYYN